MTISDISVRRPVFAAVLAILMVLVGIVGYLNLPVREYPDTEPPIVSVDTNYTGAAATVVESRVTQVLENALAGIEGAQVGLVAALPVIACGQAEILDRHARYVLQAGGIICDRGGLPARQRERRREPGHRVFLLLRL